MSKREQGSGDELTFVEHLGELRTRIIRVLIVFAVALLLGLAAAQPVIAYLKSVPPAADITWNAFSPWDGIRIYMSVSLLGAILLALPFALFQLWAFVSPGLRPSEQTASLKYVPISFFLFLIGLAFAYFVVFPMAFFFTSLMTQRLHLTETYGIAQYFAFMFNIIIPVSLMFELPVVVMFLTKLRLINPVRLRKLRKYAYFVLFVASALITPPDVISAVVVTVPLVILYEISIAVSGLVYRKQLAADKAWEAEYGAGQSQGQG